MRQSELISELERRGYEITERRLTDWRSKGLLPKLKQVGQGRGSGTIHVIEDPETTINQAIAVFEMHKRRWRTDSALLGIWCLGFDVDPTVLRNAWLKRFKAYQMRIEQKGKKTGDVADYFSIVAKQIAENAVDQHGLPFEATREIVTELNVIIHGRQKFEDPFEFDDFTDQLFVPEIQKTIFANWEIPPEKREIIAKNIMQVFQSLKFQKIILIVKNATDEELRWAHKIWAQIRQELKNILLQLNSTDVPVQKLQDHAVPAKLAFGFPVIFALICFAKFDDTQRIDDTMEWLGKALAHSKTNSLADVFRGLGPSSAQDSFSPTPEEFRDGISQHWDDFSAGEFLKKIEKFQA
jgi:hypothetical protein